MKKDLKTIDLPELRKLQMDVLSAIDNYCRDNDIHYSIAAGTLLGAVRHKGYIPWDDDIDIYMYRTEYDKLIHSFPLIYDGNIAIVSLERNKKWDRAYAKAYDIRTVFDENATTTVKIGVNIDILPIDDVPDDIEEYEKYNQWRKKRYWHYQITCFPFRKGRNIFKNIYLVFLKIGANIIGRHRIGKQFDHVVQYNNGKGYLWCSENCLGLYAKRFPKTVFQKYIDLPFEERSYKAFADYDIVLRALYGEYMKLPPKEKRVTHHDFKAYWK